VRLYVIAVDEPIYLNPYVRSVIETCGADVVGVAQYRGRAFGGATAPAGRIVSLALLSLLVFSRRNWIRLAAYKTADVLGRLVPVSSSHRLADICRDFRVPLTTIDSANAPEFVQQLRDLSVDVVLHQSPEILRGDILRTPTVGVINRHMASLPAYRGAWPVFWQFVNGEQCFGVTIHKVDEGIDSGDIIVRESVPRLPGDTISSVYERLFARSVQLTHEAIGKLIRREGVIRNDAAGTLCYRTPAAGEVLRFILGRPLAPVRRQV
jgi:folate-dependent phosphoribosylglycinamide formyltransferase PurN